jgi:predicted nucleic-acid-binding Zn-ribbon protein
VESKQQERLQEWITEKWNHGACPVCGANSYQVGAEIGEIRPIAGLSPGKGAYPVVPVNCTNCGYTVLINAIVAGVLRRPEPADDAVESMEEESPSEASGIA